MVNGSLAETRRRGTPIHFWIAILVAIALSLFFIFNISNASADTTNNVVMTVVDSGGNPISGATINDQGGSYANLGTTDATGTVSAHLSAGTYSFDAVYHGTTATYGPVTVATDSVTTHTFQTIKAQVNLQTCDGTGVAGGQARYTNGYTYYFGGPTDANGIATYELFPGTYDVEMDYTNAAVHQTVDFNSTSSATFNTVPVTLFNSGTIRYQNASGGSIAYYTGPTMQMLPATYTFEASGTHFNVTVPANCTGITGGLVRLVDHNGNGLAGGSVSVYSGGWSLNIGTTDSNGNYVFSAPTSSGLSIGMTYQGMYNQQSLAQLTASHFTFQTVLTTLKLIDADGNGLSGGSALENAYYPLGTTDGSGIITAELLPGNYTFAMVYNGTRQNIVQNNGTNPVVTFQTGRVTLYYSGAASFSNSQFYPFTKPSMEFLPGTISIDVGGSAGQCQPLLTIAAGDHLVKSAIAATLMNHGTGRLAGGVVSAYVGGRWVQFDATTNGAGIACQLFDGQLGNVSVAMVYNGTRQQITQNQPSNSVYAFQTGQVTIELKNSSGALIDTGAASYYAGGWHDLGNTTGGKVAVEVLPGTYAFAMVYDGERNQVSQAVTNGSTVVFQTVHANVQLLDSHGAGIAGGDASFYASGWRTFGTTDANGQAYQEMLPGSYSFAMVYNGERQQLNGQDVSSPVSFQTVLANVRLLDHSGAGLANGAVSYYAGGWHDFGTTGADGNAYQEMLPGSYSFATVFEGERQQLNGQDVSSPITFQTVLATVTLTNSSGTGLANGDVSYYAGSWQTFGTTDASGQAMREMLPGSYSFAMVYLGGRQQLNGQNVANTIAYQTGQVHSDSGTATSYYAGGWHTFTQDMELLPGSYAFHFSSHAQTNYTVTGGMENHIF
jgi:flagellar hook assembly protein FlgD